MQRGSGNDLLWNELRRSLSILVPGAALGLFGAWAEARSIQSLPFGLSALDPFVLGGAPSVLCGVVLLAAWLPARRAARIDPATVLQSDERRYGRRPSPIAMTKTPYGAGHS